METTRQKYTTEFKRDAVALFTEQRYTITTSDQNLGITPKLLSRWKGASSSIGKRPFLAKGIKRRSKPNCASYERKIVGCGSVNTP
jgi:transposase